MKMDEYLERYQEDSDEDDDYDNDLDDWITEEEDPDDVETKD